jgi:hypothetical protein
MCMDHIFSQQKKTEGITAPSAGTTSASTCIDVSGPDMNKNKLGICLPIFYSLLLKRLLVDKYTRKIPFQALMPVHQTCNGHA